MISQIRKRLGMWSLVLALVCFISLVSLPITTGSQEAHKFQIRQAAQSNGAYPAPVIRVTAKKNKRVYDTIEPLEGGLRFPIQVRGRCGSEGSKNHLENSTSVTLYSGTTRGSSDSFPVDKSHRSIGADHGVGWNDYTVVFPYIRPHIDPIKTCNSTLNEATEEARVPLLQRGFNISLADAYEAGLGITCMIDQGFSFNDVPELSTDRTRLGINVRCMPSGYVPTTEAPPRHGVRLDPVIESVFLKADPAELKGHACPVYVGFRGQITAGQNRPSNEPFKIKYRFVGDRGFSTSFYEETMKNGETKPVFWKRRIEAPSHDPGTIAAPGKTPRIPIYQGWTTLEVVYPQAPDKPLNEKVSQKTTFIVDCNPVPQRTPPPRGPRIKPNP
jgi:hypothetical protein